MIESKLLGILGLAKRAGKVAFGTESVKEAVQKKQISLVLIAQDAADRTKKNFIALCKDYQIAIRIIGSIEELSKAIGQNKKAVFGIKEKNFSREMIKIIDGGDIIG